MPVLLRSISDDAAMVFPFQSAISWAVGVSKRGATRHLELAENVVEIVLHRVGADAERLSHLLVGLPPGNLLEDLSLAQSQRVIVLTGTRGSPGVPSLLGRRRGLGETRSAQSV